MDGEESQSSQISAEGASKGYSPTRGPGQADPYQGATSFPSLCGNSLTSLAGNLLGKTQKYLIFKGLEYSACLWPLFLSALFVAQSPKVIVNVL